MDPDGENAWAFAAGIAAALAGLMLAWMGIRLRSIGLIGVNAALISFALFEAVAFFQIGFGSSLKDAMNWGVAWGAGSFGAMLITMALNSAEAMDKLAAAVGKTGAALVAATFVYGVALIAAMTLEN